MSGFEMTRKVTALGLILRNKQNLLSKMAIFLFLFVLPLDVGSHHRHKIPKHKTIIWFFNQESKDLVFARPCL